MDTYNDIRSAIAETAPALLDAFDAECFAERPTYQMGDWLDENLPIKGGWEWRGILQTADIIRNLETYQ